MFLCLDLHVHVHHLFGPKENTKVRSAFAPVITAPQRALTVHFMVPLIKSKSQPQRLPINSLVPAAPQDSSLLLVALRPHLSALSLAFHSQYFLFLTDTAPDSISGAVEGRELLSGGFVQQSR